MLSRFGVGEAAARSVRGRYARSAFWSIGGSVASQGFALLSTIAVARMLGRDKYGELGVVNRTVSMFGLFAGYGLGTCANRYLAELRSSDPQRAGRIWGLVDNVAISTSLIAAVLVVALSSLLSVRVLRAPQVAPLLCLSVAILVFNTLMGVQNGVLAGFEAFRLTAIVNVVRGVVNIPLVVAGAWFWGLPGAVVALGAVALAGFLVGRVAMNAEARRYGVTLSRRGVLSEWPVLWHFSLPAYASTAILITGEWFCEALLVRQASGLAQMGLYSAAIQWTNAIEFLQTTMASPAISLMANLYWSRQQASFRRLALGNLALIGGVAGSAAAVIALAAPWIMRAYGSDFGGAVGVLRLVCLMAAVRAVSRCTSAILYATNHVRLEWGCSMVRIAVQLGLWYVLIPRGASGLALALFGAFGVQLALQSLFVWRVLAGPAPAAPMGEST